MNLSTEQALSGALASAVRRFDVGDLDAAIHQTTDIIRRRPDHVPARLLLARALLAYDRPADALRQLDAADQYMRQTDGQPLEDLAARHMMLRATALARLQRPDQAQQALRGLLQHQPDHREALRQLARWEVESGELVRAFEHLQRLLHLEPRDTQALRLVIDTHDAMGDAEAALQALEQLESLDPLAAPGAVRRARLLRRAGRLADAQAQYRELADEFAIDPQLAHEAALLAIELGDDASACRWLMDVIDAEDELKPTARLDLIHQHMRTARFGPAARLCRRAIADDVGSRAPAIAALMVCACVEGRDRLIDRCGRMLRRVVDRADDRRQIVAEAWAQAVPGMLLQSIVQSRPEAEQADPLSALLEEAVESLDTAAAEQPDHADRHYHLAVAHAALEQDDAAVVALDRALALNRRYVNAAQLRARLLAKDGHDQAARAVLHAADLRPEAA